MARPEGNPIEGLRKLIHAAFMEVVRSFAGILASLKVQKRKRRMFVISSSIGFGITYILFLLTYGILPQFDRTNVRLPVFCEGTQGDLTIPSRLRYALPNGEIGILIKSNAETAVVATIDTSNPSDASTVFVVSKDGNKMLRTMHFENDVISAAIDEGIVYIFNDKLGYLLDEHTGEDEKTFLKIDNYGGLSQSNNPILPFGSDGYWYMETTGIISSWHIDGKVKSRPRLVFNGIARGCFISGETGQVINL
ncbi:MAG: hypothetical protein AAB553_06420 [Patescibacteria group bacterium]